MFLTRGGAQTYCFKKVERPASLQCILTNVVQKQSRSRNILPNLQHLYQEQMVFLMNSRQRIPQHQLRTMNAIIFVIKESDKLKTLH